MYRIGFVKLQSLELKDISQKENTYSNYIIYADVQVTLLVENRQARVKLDEEQAQLDENYEQEECDEEEEEDEE